MTQLNWNDVAVGDELVPVSFPLSVYRLVVAAGAVRDFNSMHHNSRFARATGAPEMYANTTFLLGMWERTVRAYVGFAGIICRIEGFRMNSFNCAGNTLLVRGAVHEKWLVQGSSGLKIRMWTENGNHVSVGPGLVTVRQFARPSD